METHKTMQALMGLTLLLLVQAYDDCPDKCHCTPALSIRRQQNWMTMTHNNRYIDFMIPQCNNNNHF